MKLLFSLVFCIFLSTAFCDEGSQTSSQKDILSSLKDATTDYVHDDGAKVNDERNSEDTKLVVEDMSATHCRGIILRCERGQRSEAYCRRFVPRCQGNIRPRQRNIRKSTTRQRKRNIRKSTTRQRKRNISRQRQRKIRKSKTRQSNRNKRRQRKRKIRKSS